jgi:hypothetical protein
MNKFSPRIFIISTLLIGLIATASFFALFQITQGSHYASNWFWIFLARLFYLFSFPILMLAWNIFPDDWTVVFTLVYFLDCIIYAVVIERLIWLFKRIAHSNAKV